MDSILNKVILLYKKNHFPTSIKENISLDIHKYTCPLSVKNHLHELTNSIQYITFIHHQKITISFFYQHSKDKCRERFNHIVVALSLFKPDHPVNIDILFSSVKKTLPSYGMLTEEHVNTGYSIRNNIVVYREEEWFKVFIHECFHNLNFDIILETGPWNEEISKVFPISTDIYLRESYCEIWARILICIFTSAYHKLSLDRLLDEERKYSRHQVSKILNYIGLSYSDLQKPSSYKEGTNVFAYYFLTDILMNLHGTPYSFVNWCYQHHSIFKLKNPKGYLQLIQSNIPDSKVFVYHHKNTSTKMSKTNIELLYENT
jgi:hypothetical protein